MRAILCTALLASLASGASCGKSASNEAVPDAAYNCATETRADMFSAGMTKVGTQGMLTFKLMSSTPAPPARNNNEWVIDIVDSTGAPVAGAAVTVTPFMPDHNHGTSIKAVVTETSPGQYDVNPVNLWMPGFWQTTVEATPVGGTADTTTFNFCISS